MEHIDLIVQDFKNNKSILYRLLCRSTTDGFRTIHNEILEYYASKTALGLFCLIINDSNVYNIKHGKK